METPALTDALRAKYEALRADFGDKAPERLREVVEHALEQVTGSAGARRGRPAKATGSRRKGRRSWTPAQRAEQRKKMQAYWAAKRGPKKQKTRGKKPAAAAAAAG